MYTIHWENKITGYRGHGTSTLEYRFAEKYIKKLNEKYPDVEHTLKKVE